MGFPIELDFTFIVLLIMSVLLFRISKELVEGGAEASLDSLASFAYANLIS